MRWIQVSHDWDWRSAEASYRRALELAPGNALILHQASWLAASMGRLEEAIGLARRAVEQDPLSASAYTFFGTTLWVADRLADAVAALRKALELAPQRAITRASLAIGLLDLGRAEEALAEASGARPAGSRARLDENGSIPAQPARRSAVGRIPAKDGAGRLRQLSLPLAWAVTAQVRNGRSWLSLVAIGADQWPQ